jgi:hypothetical protein
MLSVPPTDHPDVFIGVVAFKSLEKSLPGLPNLQAIERALQLCPHFLSEWLQSRIIHP